MSTGKRAVVSFSGFLLVWPWLHYWFELAGIPRNGTWLMSIVFGVFAAAALVAWVVEDME